MTLTLDISQDLLLCDGLRTMTLKISGATDTALTDCVLDEPVKYKEMDPAQGQVPQGDLMFVWPSSFSVRPPLGSVLVDEEGIYWTVLKVLHKDLVQCWEATCRNLSITPSTRNTITILKATYDEKGDANEAKATWYGLWSNEPGGDDEDEITARIQPSVETAELEFGAEWSKQVYRVYFNDPVPLELAGGEYRIVDSSGFVYRVMRYYNEERIDTLPVAVVIRVTEGDEYWGNPGGGM